MNHFINDKSDNQIMSIIICVKKKQTNQVSHSDSRVIQSSLVRVLN